MGVVSKSNIIKNSFQKKGQVFCGCGEKEDYYEEFEKKKKKSFGVW